MALKFDKKWWSYKIGGADFSGHIDSSGSDSGVDEGADQVDDSLFNVFYDIPTPSDSEPTLLTIISGLALEPYHTMTDEEVIKGALNALKVRFSMLVLSRIVSILRFISL